ncbi:hypothetical protein CEXT_695091 [Caerostris extrusa]|uniref:Uncharacterized protein n=1 Tax=Caerostris extrusa TaxID=172846 RepID=A0AAV4X2M9_CAEEX|nr:hypothetical protein CEXT_695091 [Caerostris extrusa]
MDLNRQWSTCKGKISGQRVVSLLLLQPESTKTGKQQGQGDLARTGKNLCSINGKTDGGGAAWVPFIFFLCRVDGRCSCLLKENLIYLSC